MQNHLFSEDSEFSKYRINNYCICWICCIYWSCWIYYSRWL